MAHSKRLQEFAGKQVGRIQANVKRATASGDVEGVHGLRVASRRLKEPLDLIAPWLGPKRAKKWMKKLGRIRRGFNVVRDLDVLLMSLSADETTPDMGPEDRARLEGLLTAERERALRKATAGCEAGTAARVGGKISDAFAAYCDAAREADEARLADDVRAMWRERATAALKLSPVADAGVDLHELRVRLKQLRYCTELLGQIEDAPRTDLQDAMKRMQDELGSWSDHQAAATRLAALATEPTMLATQSLSAASILVYSARRARLMETRRQAILRRWPGLAEAVTSSDLATGMRVATKRSASVWTHGV